MMFVFVSQCQFFSSDAKFFANLEWEGLFFCQVKFKTPTYVNDFTR